MKHNKMMKLLTLICSFCLIGGLSACKSSNTSSLANPIGSVESIAPVYISEKNLTLKTGEQHTLSLGNGTVKEWQSSNVAVATVNGGVVVAAEEGLAFITATTETDEKFTCMVNVTNEETTVEIALSTYVRTIGIQDVITVAATPTKGGETLASNVEWSVSDSAVVETVKHGNLISVKGLKAGTVQIVASLDNSAVALDLTVRGETQRTVEFENPDEMATAPLTKTVFAESIKVKDVVQGESSVIYPTTHYGKYDENTAMALFGTLTGQQREFEWKTSGHFAYGFLVEPIQITDSLMYEAESDYHVYYAFDGADENGNYGVFIGDLPEGYYEVRSFVEYEQGGEIIREISAERSVAGEMSASFVTSSNSFIASTIDTKWTYGGDVGFYEDVKNYSESYTDIQGETHQAKYVIDADTFIENDNATLPSIMFRVQSEMSKRMLQEYLNDGIALLKFNVLYRTDVLDRNADGKVDSKDQYKGMLRTLNVNLLDEECRATSSHFDDTIAWSFSFSNQQRSKYTKKVREAIATNDAYTNTWYEVRLDVEKLVEYYDVLFHDHSGYPLCVFSMDNRVSAGESGNGEVLISDFSFETVALDNLVSDSNLLHFYRTLNKTNAWGMPGYGSVEVTGEKPEETLTYTDSNNVTKEVAYSFEIPVEEKQKGGHWMLMGVDLSALTKETLIKLQAKGYEKLTFSFVYHTSYQWQLEIATLNFDYLRENRDVKLDGTTYIKKNAYTIQTINEGSPADDWHTIEYSIADLIDCYEQISFKSWWLLGAAWTNYMNAETEHCYLTKIAIVKGEE